MFWKDFLEQEPLLLLKIPEGRGDKDPYRALLILHHWLPTAWWCDLIVYIINSGDHRVSNLIQGDQKMELALKGSSAYG